MKTISLIATVLVLPAASLLAQGTNEMDQLKARLDLQERRISQLESALLRLGGQAGEKVVREQDAGKPEPRREIQDARGKKQDWVEYRVVGGDTLTRIASKHQTTVAAIKRENALKSDALRVGQKLKIPAVEANNQRVEAAKAAVPAAGGETKKYQVCSGDTFYGIARKYKITEAALQAANPKAVPTRLQIGQWLVIDPAAEVSAKRSEVKKTVQKAPAAKPPVAKPPAAKKEVAKSSSSASTVQQGSSVPEKPSSGIRTITVREQMTYGAFANQHGASTSQLNALNGLNLSKSTLLAKGSELYVPLY